MNEPRYQRLLKVAFGDTDASGWVHFPNVFRYVEIAEHEYLESLGIGVYDLNSGGWPRVEVACRYQVPLRAGDEILVKLWVGKVGRSSVEWRFEIEKGGQVAAAGTMTTVRVGVDGKSQALGDEVRQKIEGALEA